ncbi:hypothetical protein EJF18_30511 [Clavispora lusitaniae]|uniref:Uncharacterized protein n=2 Tax=Clavispora lusitaniae TaxID=36911 RepID=A0ACD0WJ86_CLALS|nr:hypothetical protein A9F13_07g00847 [Clavispora lusitaniae]QFZ27537.1 hypothetical protein EJF14_30511 [Clavispora lusitaniae]QFZ33155.1 hypothetical protein EJF16_30511 [Clavispora lusitaniae]QFZ38826.1 hypothetical protein EJF15_30511 [Clavispora lusitaniae]QFZ44508.1 hypothetical protein EJF18_30511 [Clavispora lusitaniae]
MLRRFARALQVPPSHFSNPSSFPPPYGQKKPSETQDVPLEPSDSEYSQEHQPSTRSLRDLSSVIAMFTLAYLAVDNYSNRVKLEKLNAETTAINLKTIQLQQQNFLNARKQQDLQMLNERLEISKRCFKMALHIALLRKQLADMGVEPAEISQVIQEFERHVKINNSVQNLTGSAMWLEDSSPLNKYLPNYREYDKNP